MTRQTILEIVAANRKRLQKLGVRELGLFGSFARGDSGPDSNIDFVVDLEEKPFDRYMSVKELLESLLATVMAKRALTVAVAKAR